MDGADVEKDLPPLPEEEAETHADADGGGAAKSNANSSASLAYSGTSSVGLSGNGGHGPIYYRTLFTTLALSCPCSSATHGARGSRDRLRVRRRTPDLTVSQ